MNPAVLGMVEGFMEASDGDDDRTFNGLCSFLEECSCDMSPEEVDYVASLGEAVLYKMADPIDTLRNGTNFEQIDEAMERLTQGTGMYALLRVLFVKNVLDSRGLWEPFCTYRQAMK